MYRLLGQWREFDIARRRGVDPCNLINLRGRMWFTAQGHLTRSCGPTMTAAEMRMRRLYVALATAERCRRGASSTVT
jgi:hypothetical protein